VTRLGAIVIAAVCHAQPLYFWPENFFLQNGQRFTVALHQGIRFPVSELLPTDVKDPTLHVAKYQYNLLNPRVEGNRLLLDGTTKAYGNQILTARLGNHFAKAIVNSQLPGAYGMAPVGQEMEIVPLANPSNALPGQAMTFLVLHKGKPVADAALVLAHTNGEARDGCKTGAEGKCAALLPWPGGYRLYVAHEGLSATLVFALH
jgi:uncharacterized GH25 family protein